MSGMPLNLGWKLSVFSLFVTHSLKKPFLFCHQRLSERLDKIKQFFFFEAGELDETAKGNLGNSYLPAFKAVVKTPVAFNGKFVFTVE
ncbi:MAG: hypothetical protein WCB90_15060 [Methanosarcina sp.]